MLLCDRWKWTVSIVRTVPVRKGLYYIEVCSISSAPCPAMAKRQRQIPDFDPRRYGDQPTRHWDIYAKEMPRPVSGSDVRKNTHACCFLIVFVFVSIGVPLIVLGCNANLEGGCVTYDVVRGTVYGYRIEEATCQNCEDDGQQNNNPHSPRTCGPKFSCDDVYVKLNYGGPEDICEIHTGKDHGHQEQSLSNIRDSKFPLNTTHTFVLQKGDDSVCLLSSEGIVMWYFGVVFLVLTGVTSLCWIGCTAFKTEEQYNQYAAELSNPPPRHNQVAHYTASYATSNRSNRNFSARPPVDGVTEVEMVDAADLQRRHAAAPHTCGSTLADVSPAVASPANPHIYASAPAYVHVEVLQHTSVYAPAAYAPVYTNTIAYTSAPLSQTSQSTPMGAPGTGINRSYFEEYNMY